MLVVIQFEWLHFIINLQSININDLCVDLILERSKPREMEILTTKIIPIVIKLACDLDNLVQQLFEPLAIGIVHYFASGIQYNSIYTAIIIDILMASKTIIFLLIFFFH